MKKSSKKASHKLSKNKRSKQKSFKKELYKSLTKNFMKIFQWKNKTVKSIAGTIYSLLWFGKIQQKDLARGINNENKTESNIRALQRFFKNEHVDYKALSETLFRRIYVGKKIRILIDRTNWDYGQKHINLLVAAALWDDERVGQQFAIPLAWDVFNKKGNSSMQERKLLMQRLINTVGPENIEEILGDREFIGDEWIAFLHENLIPFVLRFKKNMYIEFEGQKIKAQTLVGHVQHKEKVVFNIILNEIPMQLVATRSVDKELIIVIASMNIQEPLNEYRLRWLIELFFKSIKSKGFRFEDTHMTNPESIKKLFALTTIATLIAVQFGTLKHCFVKKIPVKNHGRPTYSLFTYGVDFIRELFEGNIFFEIKMALINILAPPKKSISCFLEYRDYALLKG